VTTRIHPFAPALAFSAKLISGAQARWFNCEPLPRQRIYFGNHSSHLDPLVLWAALPPEIRASTRPIAAKNYWGRDHLRCYVATRIFQAVLIDRPEHGVAHHGILDPIVQALNQGASLILFPEGTRGSGEQIAPFKSGLYHLCMLKPDVEAVPVCLENLNRVLPKGAIIPVPLISRVTFGRPMQVRASESKEGFLERARAAISELRDV